MIGEKRKKQTDEQTRSDSMLR